MDILIHDPEKTAKIPLLEEEMKSIINFQDALIRGIDPKASFVWAKKGDEKKIKKMLDGTSYSEMDEGGNKAKGRMCLLVHLDCYKIEKMLKAEKAEDTEAKKELCTASAEKQ